MKRVHLKVKGKVQGVFYRDSTKEKADELGLKGYVKNLPDGSVEIIAEGSEDKLNKLIAWTKIGPPLAEVKDVKVEWESCKSEFSDFSVRR